MDATELDSERYEGDISIVYTDVITFANNVTDERTVRGVIPLVINLVQEVSVSMIIGSPVITAPVALEASIIAVAIPVDSPYSSIVVAAAVPWPYQVCLYIFCCYRC